MVLCRKLCITTLAIALLLAAPLQTALATDGVTVLQAYVTGQTLTVFTSAALGADALQCAVSNQGAQITQTGTLADGSAAAMTTLLVDISTSMPRETRGALIEALNSMVENKAAYEHYRVATFGEQLVVLQDFTADRFDLASAIGKIEFNNRETQIYDALYNTIPVLAGEGETPAFYRTIVFTDGIDDTTQGITREELYLRLQNEHYPVEVVEVSRAETTENRDLAAIVRMSGGRYHSLTPNADRAALTQALGVNDYFYFTATVPAPLLDGTTRQVDISDGARSMSVDVRFPVYNAPAENTPGQPVTDGEQSVTDGEIADAPETANTPDLENGSQSETNGSQSETNGSQSETNGSRSETMHRGETKPDAGMFGEYTLVIIVGAGIALVITAAVIIAAIVVRGKKKKAAKNGVYGSVSNGSSDETEFIGAENASSPSVTGCFPSSGTPGCVIKVGSINNPSKTWELPVNDGLIVGRAAHCPIRLEDKSVSREQCKITTDGIGLFVEHLGSTNRTYLNGNAVTEKTPLKFGDTLKIGRESLRVEYIDTHSASSWAKRPITPNDGLTEHVYSE